LDFGGKLEGLQDLREKTVTGAIAPKLTNERSERNGLFTSHVSPFTFIKISFK